ncbi:MAG: DnaJ domain-containing protein [Nitrosopumilaceae archaeon]|nr:DnaJ domain-containing protein [Nitrosopumilaceae archaeon]
MKIIPACFLLILSSFVQSAFAQELNMELVVTDEQRIILFSIFIIGVIAIFIYLARDVIFRKKTKYDEEELESKKNKDYEKYHSDWSDDYEEFGSRSKQRQKELREELEDGTYADYYKILGVDPKATPIEIKKRYRELAKKLHPDKSKSTETEKEMSRINKAYEILSDKELREKYDRYFDPSTQI